MKSLRQTYRSKEEGGACEAVAHAVWDSTVSCGVINVQKCITTIRDGNQERGREGEREGPGRYICDSKDEYGDSV